MKYRGYFYGFDYPPIPIRWMDWVASDDEGQCIAEAATKEELFNRIDAYIEEQEAMKEGSELLDFLKDWLSWAESDPQDDKKYSRKGGLCCATVKERAVKGNKVFIAIRKNFNDELYPFGGKDRYFKDQKSATMHKNELRLAWVRKTIKELENA